MQYILTQEELNALNERARRGEKAPNKKKLQALCTLVADNIPVKGGWMDGKVWGCILSTKEEWYCDECPAREVCPYEYQSWSK